MQPPHSQNHFVCLDCTFTQPQPGTCGRCGSDPVLDMRDPNVREMCTEQDTDRRTKRDELFRYVSIPVGIVLTLVVCVIVPPIAILLGIVPFFFGYILGMVGATLVVMVLLKSIFPYRDRFPRNW